jgi:predicted porin
LDLGLGYEKHKDVTGAAAARSEDGWVFGGAYRFANNLRLGGTYTRQKFERGTAAAPTEGKVTAWHVGMDWMITGPHGIRAAYTRANDMKSNQVAPFGGIGGGAVAVVGGIPVVAAGTGFGPPYRPACNAVTACSNTGATLYQIRYVYQMSKRTEFTAGYSKMDNKGAAAYQLYGLSSNNLGRDQSAIAIALDHRF